MSDSASLESAPLLPNERQEIEMALNCDVRIKHSLVYGLLTDQAVWLAQVSNLHTSALATPPRAGPFAIGARALTLTASSHSSSARSAQP